MKITKTLCVDLDQKLADYLSVFLHLSQANKTITLYAKGYAREEVDESEILKILQAAKGKLPLFNLYLKKDARGIYIEMRHVSDYSAEGVPIRLF